MITGLKSMTDAILQRLGEMMGGGNSERWEYSRYEIEGTYSFVGSIDFSRCRTKTICPLMRVNIWSCITIQEVGRIRMEARLMDKS